MAFHVGQKVVCIYQVTPELMAAYPGGIWPEKGGVYTIRTINVWPNWTLLTLAEIDNGHMIGKWSKIEPGFDAIKFRPAVEKKTDISIFTAMLNTKQRELVK